MNCSPRNSGVTPTFTKVDGQWIPDIVNAKAEEHKDNPLTSKLEWQKTVNAGNGLKQTIATFSTTLSTFKVGLNFDLEFKRWCTIEVEVRETVGKLNRYLESFSGFSKQLVDTAAALLEKFRNRRDTTSLFLRTAGVPTCLAKAIADYWHASVDTTTAEHGIVSVGEVTGNMTQLDMDELCRGCVYLRIDDTPGGNEWSTQAKEHWTASKAALEQASNEYVTQCIERGTHHSHHYLVKDVVARYPFSTSVFAPLDDVPAEMQICKKYDYDGRHLSQPERGQRMTIQGVSGVTCFVVLDRELARAADPLDRWIGSAHHTALAQCQVWAVRPGDVLYVSFGMVAIPLAVDIGKDGYLQARKSQRIKRKDDYNSYLVHLLYDKDMDARHPAESRNFVNALWLQSQPYIDAGMRSNAGVVAWSAMLAASPRTEAAAIAPESVAGGNGQQITGAAGADTA